MKKFLPLLIVFFALNAFAVNISMPSSVPEGSIFTLLAEITETNFDEIKVYLDNETVFTHKAFSQPDYSHIAFFDYDPRTADYLSLVFHPLNSGSYTARVELFRNNSRIKSDEFEFDVYSIARTRDIESLTREISKDLDSLTQEIETTQNTTTELESKLSALSDNVEGFEEIIEEIETGNTALEESVSEVQASLNELNQALSEINTDLAELASDKENTSAILASLSDRMDGFEEQVSAPIGFFAVGQGLAVVAGLLIVILALAFFVRRKRAGGPLFESDSGESAYEGPSEGEIEGLEETQEKGKWAFEGETEQSDAGPEKEQTEKRFSLGDLIKRN